MLDSELAALYQVQTFRLNEAVKRNRARFNEDFVFQLSRDEVKSLTSQTAMPRGRRGGRRTLPYVFTEHGVAMLSSVLDSDRAIQMNIQIFRAFVRASSVIEVLAEDIDRLGHDSRQIKTSPVLPKRKIGFDL